MAEDKKTEVNRKHPNIPPTGDYNSSKKNIRFNIYWVYLLVF